MKSHTDLMTEVSVLRSSIGDIMKRSLIHIATSREKNITFIAFIVYMNGLKNCNFNHGISKYVVKSCKNSLS